MKNIVFTYRMKEMLLQAEELLATSLSINEILGYFRSLSLITLSHHCSDQTDIIIHSYPDMGHTQVLIGLKSIQTLGKGQLSKGLMAMFI